MQALRDAWHRHFCNFCLCKLNLRVFGCSMTFPDIRTITIRVGYIDRRKVNLNENELSQSSRPCCPKLILKSRYSLIHQSSRRVSIRSASSVHLHDFCGRAVGSLRLHAQHRFQSLSLGDGHHQGPAGCRLRKHGPVPPEHVCMQISVTTDWLRYKCFGSLCEIGCHSQNI